MADIPTRSMLQAQDLTKMIRDRRIQQEVSDREKELNMYRSGSAPPTVEGSFNSLGGLMNASSYVGVDRINKKAAYLSEEELRADPEYVNYYHSNVNLNPRLPPPFLSKEDWRSATRLHGGAANYVGGIGELSNRNGVDGVKGNISLFTVQPGLGVGKEENVEGTQWGKDGLFGLQRQRSITETLQDDIHTATSISRHPSRPASCNMFDDGLETSEPRFGYMHRDLASTDNFHSGYSISRSTTPDPHLIGRAPSPRIPPVGKRNISASNSFNDSSELAAALSGLNLSNNDFANKESLSRSHSLRKSNDSQDYNHQYSYLSQARPNMDDMSPSFSDYGYGGYGMNPLTSSVMANQLGGSLPPYFENSSSALAGGLSLQNLKLSNQMTGNALQAPAMDPFYLQYLRSNDYATIDSNYNASYMDMLELQNAYLGALLLPQKPQYGGRLSQNYYGNPAFGGVSYPGSPMSPLLPNSPIGIRHGDHNMRFSSGTNFDGNFGSTLLEEFKNNKAKCFELSEIAGHVVEFSADQYGSRFIQQKLETATTDEKDMVFNEIFPQGLSLMTDVFGNYVVQKFLEHGSASQIRELADQLTGHVMALSLQMYGCRVIQKAIEVVALDQQTNMVKELDGHIMRCVRDQNGNHVIQKCIECVPEDVIHFIVSTFYDQVVTLSTHPYGCRVIQRVLEHCHSETTQKIMMDEILNCVCMLAQDQYGNYVIQHVLEHGKPHERTSIITQLAGQIVHMSQQKFASNVIEKCLTFGTLAEREILVNEMLGSTDENEPLQVMMKDQFANYVVQKVLETCDDQQLNIILNRIKVHLNALKKYTYGKHIVARVEKLVAAGEKRISVLNLLHLAQATET